MIRPRALLWLAIGAFGAGMSALAVLQQRAFETGRFDVGNLTQAVWATAHGHFLEVTDLQGRQISRLGAHFDPIVAALAPPGGYGPTHRSCSSCRQWRSPSARCRCSCSPARHLGSEWAGLGFALVYLLYPPTQWLVVDDFHPVALATPLLLGAIWFLTEERMLPFALCAGAACLTKEQIGLVVAMLGLWHAVAHGRRPRRAPDRRAPERPSRSSPPPSSSPVTRRAAARPSRAGTQRSAALRKGSPRPCSSIRCASSSRRSRIATSSTSRDLLLPLGGLPLLAPLIALTALPELALNLLSEHAHADVDPLPLHGRLRFRASSRAAVLGAARLQRARAERVPARWRGVRWPSRSSPASLLGPLPVWRHVPFGSKLATRDHVVTAHDRAAARAVRAVPAAVPVSATNTLGAHLSERRRIFSFPVLREARWVAVDTRRPSYLDAGSARDRFGAAFARLRADRRWHVVFDEDGILVLHRATVGAVK